MFNGSRLKMDLETDLQLVPYYHGLMKRSDSEVLLRDKEDGSFLLRKSTHNNNPVLSVAYNSNFLHYNIIPTMHDGKTWYSVNNGTAYATPEQVCKHYMASKGGLRCRLTNPVLNKTSRVKTLIPDATSPMWYHDEITREEDSFRLSQGYRGNRIDGIFLIRKKEDRKHVLSLVNKSRVHRYIIQCDPITKRYSIAGKHQEFSSLDELVEFHKTNPTTITGIQCQLTHPCQKTTVPTTVPLPHPPIPNHSIKSKVRGLASELQKILPTNGLEMTWSGTKQVKEDKTALQRSVTGQSIMKTFDPCSMPQDSPGYNSPYQNFTGDNKVLAPDLFISVEHIKIYEELGKGHFGAVCLARCQIADQRVPCAVKYLTGDNIVANKTELISEASVMQTLDHPHIVRLLAVCDATTKLMMVLELAPLGPLRDFLKRHDEISFPENKIILIMTQVCHGMNFLADNNIVHRDLAARNILLVTENFAKVSDFGMSRVLHDTENYYRAVRPGSWPLRWYSPEALCFYKFTTKCDVWSYGITLWEAFSYGKRPYKGMKGREILQMLEDGERLECPIGCPPDMYNLMYYCWTFNEDERPSFKQLLQILQQISEVNKLPPPPVMPRSPQTM